MICFGRSLGGAVSIALAHRHRNIVKAVIVENTFLSISAMVDTLMPFISFAKDLVLRIGWKNEELIKDLSIPILFIAGTQQLLYLCTSDGIIDYW